MITGKAGTHINRADSKTKTLFKRLFSLIPVTLAVQQATAQTLQWATSYSGISVSALEEVEGVLSDSAGNVYATGLSGSKTSGSVIRTMKLDSKGNVVWNVTHNQPSLCGGEWGRMPLALDPTGNVIVVGAEFNSTIDNWNPLLLQLNPVGGTTLRKLTFDLGPFASFDAVAADASGIYILAHNNPNNGHPHIVHVLKLAPDGGLLWSDSLIHGRQLVYFSSEG